MSLTALTGFGSSGKRKVARHKKGFIIRADKNRFFGKESSPINSFGRCIVSSADTDNDFYLSDSGDLSFREKGGPSLHIHHNDDEIFYVVSGEFLFQIGEEIYLGKAGDTAFIPRGTPHTFANPVKNNPGRLLTMHQPISTNSRNFTKHFAAKDI